MSEAIDFTPAASSAPGEVDFTAAPAADPSPAAGIARLASVSEQNPDNAAEAITLANETGAGVGYVSENLDSVRAQHAQARTAEHLDFSPATTAYMAQSQAHADLVKHDVPHLSTLEWWFGRYEDAPAPPNAGPAERAGAVPNKQLTVPPAWLSALAQGVFGQRARELALKQATVGLMPEEELSLQQAEEAEAAPTPGADTTLGKIGTETVKSVPFLLGDIIARRFGGPAASKAYLVYQNFGPLYRRLRTATDDAGHPAFTDNEARVAASAGSLVVGLTQEALGGYFLKLLPGARAEANGAIQNSFVRALLADPVKWKAALARGMEAGQGVLSGLAAMVAQGVTNAGTEESLRFAKTGEFRVEALTAAAKQAATDFLYIAPLAAFVPFRDFVHDWGRIQKAPIEAGRLDRMVEAAKAAGVTTRAPAEMAKIVDSMAAEGDAQTVYVDHEALLKQPDAAAKVPLDALAEAVQTKGDVAVPAGEYLTRLAEHHDALREDVTLSPPPDGMTLRAAAETQNGALSRALAERDVAKAMPDGPERRTALQAAHDKIRDAAVAQYGGTPEEWNGKVDALPSRPPAAEPPAPSGAALKETAAQMTEAKRLGDLQPGRRAEAARRASDKLAELATEAAKTGTEAARQGFLGGGMQAAGAEQTPAAGKANLREAGKKANRAEAALAEVSDFENARDLNRALAKAEGDALKEAEQNRKFLLKYTQDAARGELGKAGAGHLEQVDRLLAGFELGQGASRTEVARRLATMQWIADEQAQGRTPVIPDSVMAKLDRFVHWKEMTPQELRDLRLAVESVAHQAHLKNTILAEHARVDAVMAKSAIVEAAFKNVSEHTLYQEGDVVPLREQAADLARRAGAVVVRPEEYVRRIDKGAIDGPMSKFLWHPLSEAYNDFLLLERKWSKPIKDAIDAMPPELKKRFRSETFVIAGKERTMEQAIVVGLNHMNPSNRSKFERGYTGVEHLGIESFTPDHIEQFLGKLDRPAWEFAQTIVDALEAAWPEISAHEQRLSGIPPEKVKSEPFTRTLPDGSTITLRGGYYPVIYDPKFPGRGQAARDALFASNYTTAKTPQGRLNSRIEEYARPIALTLNQLPRVIREFAKDTAMREAVTSAWSIVQDPTVTNALDRTIGDAGRRVLQGAVRDSANDMALPGNGAELAIEMLSTLRGGVSSSIFSWNISQYLQNYSGFVQTLKHVPVPFVKGALGKLLTEYSAFVDANRAESSEMATRADHVNADTALAIRKLRGSGTGKIAEFSEAGMRFWASSDGIVASVTYGAARDHALAPADRGGLGYTQQDAIRYAERVVRLALGSGRTLDLPAFLRHPVLRQFAPFQGWTSAMFNDYLASVYNARQFWQQGEYRHALKEFQGTIVASTFLGLLSSLLFLKGPKDKEKDGLDPGDVARWIATEGILQPTQWVPYFGQPLKAIAEGEKLRFSLFVPPAGRPIETAANAIAALHGKAEGGGLETEDFTKLGLKGLEALAQAKGIPVIQIKNTVGYLTDENQPKETVLQLGLGVAGGKSRDGKLLKLTE